MYIPKHYQEHDVEKIKQFIDTHPFATIVSNNQNHKPLATHLPLLIQPDTFRFIITGHFAKGNEQWKSLDDNEEVLLIFQGPHAYISSTWYSDEDVPTWDYQSVQLYGRPFLLDEDEVKEDLITLLKRFEKKDGARWENMSDDTLKQIHGVVGFRIEITEVYAANKLSQNRTAADYENIIQHLSKENPEIADAMKKESN
ncbi:protease [Staphylococcus carnosus]|uniref:FMN-binding negative transcriptional regulator n=1 Tax=Staphylococcus carnosus TaxID=1281 RepID=UPI0006ABB787|nr:FMN-binding negative transcriptional regulator [Staphylococcus carnosus]KOR12983.1 protease [Staphylococcus carnosus]